jgi:folate-dependent phosphoribosylglycinamide formyltransferase PurN
MADKICVVTAGGPYPWIIINALRRRFGPIHVVLSKPESTRSFLARRARKVGWISVAGQFATMILIRVGKVVYAGRIRRIVEDHGLEPEPRSEHEITHVESVNSQSFVEEINRIQPSVILLAGCRLLSRDVLAQIKCPVLNYHAGITPDYRGMNGGYWALATGDRKNFGATVHLVDAGVDTGQVVRQAYGQPAADDNITTYGHRLAAIAGDLCIQALDDVLAGREVRPSNSSFSRQWYHPPVWQYLWTGFRKGV